MQGHRTTNIFFSLKQEGRKSCFPVFLFFYFIIIFLRDFFDKVKIIAAPYCRRLPYSARPGLTRPPTTTEHPAQGKPASRNCTQPNKAQLLAMALETTKINGHKRRLAQTLTFYLKL
jgi:hypothetical protein